jgi:bacteriocin biosynthesis cyclodehydratase domain-containing protein
VLLLLVLVLRRQQEVAEPATVSTGRNDGGGAPERPLLPPWLRVARVGERLLLEHGDAILSLEGKAATLLLPRLLPLLDGSRTLEAIVAELGPPAEHAVAALTARGYVVEGPSASSATALLTASLARGGRTPGDVEARLAAARIAVVGAGATAEAISRLLAPGVGTVSRLRWGDDPLDVDLAVAAPCPAELPQLVAWNERLLELELPWLQMLPFNGRVAFVGPLYLPGETGCHACFAYRRGESIGEVHDLLALEDVPGRYPVDDALGAALAGLAACVALRWLATADPSLPGTAFALELGSGPAVTRHRLLRVPRCHACSGTRRLPPPQPWAEAVAR